MSSASEDQNIPQEPELGLYQREERCSRAIKNVARACVMRLVVTALLLYVLLRQSWALWMWGLLGFVMVLNLAGMLPLVKELKKQLAEQKRLRSLEE